MEENSQNLNQPQVQNPIQEPSPISPLNPASNKSRLKLPIIIAGIVIFLIIIGTASAALFLPKSNTSTPIETEVIVSPQPTVVEIIATSAPLLSSTPTSPVPTFDPTSSWKIYTSPKFSFKYPPTLYIQEPDKDFFVLTKAANTPANLAEFSVDARLSGNYSSYTTAVEKTKEGLTNITTEALPYGIKIKGKVGPGYGEGTSIIIALLKYNQSAISFETSTNPLQESLFNQILSTFKIN